MEERQRETEATAHLNTKGQVANTKTNESLDGDFGFTVGGSGDISPVFLYIIFIAILRHCLDSSGVCL